MTGAGRTKTRLMLEAVRVSSRTKQKTTKKTRTSEMATLANPASAVVAVMVNAVSPIPIRVIG